MKIDLIFQKAYLAHQNGDLQSAQKLYEQVLSINNLHFDALHLLGVLAQQVGQPRHAVALIYKAIQINPNISLVHNNLGLALQAFGDFESSIKAFDKSIELQNANYEALFNKANSLSELGRYREALDFYNTSIAQSSEFAPAYNNRGNVHQELNNLDSALEDFYTATQISSNYAQAYANMGNIQQELGKFEQAMLNYDRAIALSPDDAETNWNKSLLLLLMGNYKEGLKLHEWRWMRNNSDTPKREFKEPLWLGEESLSGKTILVHGEQGLGDSIQFCRFVKNLTMLGAKVVLEDDRALEKLFKSLDGATEFVVRGNPPPKFDFHCPMLSLPLALKLTYETVKDFTPYLKPDEIKVSFWNSKLGPKLRPRVGICWSSVSKFKYDRKRSMSFEEFSKALPKGEIEYISLQKETKESDLISLANRTDVRTFESDLIDLSDTAALISTLDCVVSTCTSIPHLSAALGIKTLTLLSFVPDWRWGVRSSDTNYYKSMRLLRQETLGNWESPISKARNVLFSLTK